jgi:hypothetical protein
VNFDTLIVEQPVAHLPLVQLPGLFTAGENSSVLESLGCWDGLWAPACDRNTGTACARQTLSHSYDCAYACEGWLHRADAAVAPHGRPIVPKLSQAALAEIVGTTRGRVNFFMNKFRKLGFIDYNGGIKIRPALLSVVLHG